MLWLVLLQFICRMTFGLSAAMWATPRGMITSGYYRVHLWVLLGCNTFAALIAWTSRATLPQATDVLALTVAASVASYIGGALWLYEKVRVGRLSLLVVAALGLLAAWQLTPSDSGTTGLPWLALAEHVSAGWLIGTTMAAMFLGHWYLNTPGMQLAPLQRLVVLMWIAIGLRAALAGGGLVAEVMTQSAGGEQFWALVALRWLSGLVGTGVLAGMTWQTLKIPNTQSATGILYVGVIFVFLGELTSQLLSPGAAYPL